MHRYVATRLPRDGFLGTPDAIPQCISQVRPPSAVCLACSLILRRIDARYTGVDRDDGGEPRVRDPFAAVLVLRRRARHVSLYALRTLRGTIILKKKKKTREKGEKRRAFSSVFSANASPLVLRSLGSGFIINGEKLFAVPTFFFVFFRKGSRTGITRTRM